MNAPEHPALRPRMLASVTTQREAAQVHQLGVDIVDLKDPHKGALGGLPVALISDIVASLNGVCVTSATIGDIETSPDDVLSAVGNVATSGVDYVKVGVNPDFEFDQLLDRICSVTQRINVVLVHFADRNPRLDSIDRTAAAGIRGVMLDTAGKRSGGLCDCQTNATLARFVDDARNHGLMSGLAGSLTLADIATLSDLQPDYLGFRGALCHSGHRTQAIDPAAVQAVRRQLDLSRQSVS